MKYILRINEWLQLNEAYFAEGSSFVKYRELGLTIMDRLINDYGYSQQLAAALTGNMFRESRFNPKAGTTYKGLVQWSRERFGTTPLTIDAQLALIDKELKGSYKSVKVRAESEPNVEKAAEVIAKKYEGCADPTHPERIQGAREIYDLYSERELPKLLAFKEPIVSPED